jgi:haloalkane dehalogenase
MNILRTPDERFANLPQYPFPPNYADVLGLRMHFVDAGPPEANPVLMLHGEPSWSYLYRKMIPPVASAGYRTIAPDLIGFGKSDKLMDKRDYSYQFHVDSIAGFIETLDLKNITLVCQDWGGLIGLRVAAEHPDRFSGIPPMAEYSQTVPDFHVGGIVKGGCRSELAPEVIAAYNAPFPDDSYKAAARVFPTLVPTRPDDPAAAANREAWEQLRRWNKPFLTAFSDSDPVTKGGERVFQKLVPGARGQAHVTIVGAGHFLQEVVDFVGHLG